MPGTSSRGRPYSGSARPSRASTVATRSCPTGRSAIPPYFQRHRPGVARRQDSARGTPGPVSDDAETLRRPIRTVDYHTAGEPFRIVTGGIPELEGRTVLERRRWAADHLDDVRRVVNEPRGHADMYGGFVATQRRLGGSRRRVLPQRGLLDRVRSRDDRAGDVGRRDGSCRGRTGAARSTSPSTCPAAGSPARPASTRMARSRPSRFHNVPSFPARAT